MTLDEFRSFLDEALAFYNSEHSGAQIDEGVAGGLGAIRYDVVQVLAEAQKERARKNLGIDELPNGGGGGGGNFEAVFDVTPASEIEAAYQAGKTITMNNNGVLYYLRERTSETRFEFTTPPYLIEMFSAIYIYTAVVENFSWSMSSTKAEPQSNKVTSISAASTNTQYPSAKAVFDYVKNNSGGGSGADLLNADGIIKQEYLPEGYPYKSAPTETVLFPEQVLTYSEDIGGFVIMSGIDASMFTEGEIYTVNWNGTDYNTQATVFSADGLSALVLGNLGAMIGSTDTGEPFVALIFPDDMAAIVGMAAQVIPLDGSEGATMSISGFIAKTTAIAQNLLPKGYPYAEFGEGYVLPLTGLTPSIDGNFFISTPFSLEAGETYTVNWNGTDYQCVCVDISAAIESPGAFAMGNIGAIMGGDVTEEPFVIINQGGIAAAVALDGSEVVVLSIYGKTEIITPIDSKYLPQSSASIGRITFDLSDPDNGFASASSMDYVEADVTALQNAITVLWANQECTVSNIVKRTLTWSSPPLTYFRCTIGYEVADDYKYEADLIWQTNQVIVHRKLRTTIEAYPPNDALTTVYILRGEYPYSRWVKAEDIVYNHVTLRSPGHKDFILTVDDNGNLTTAPAPPG